MSESELRWAKAYIGRMLTYYYEVKKPWEEGDDEEVRFLELVDALIAESEG
jgi:hypothetical protein